MNWADKVLADFCLSHAVDCRTTGGPAPQYCAAVITHRTHGGGAMNWTDRVLADPYLCRAARQLAAVIAKNFAATNARYALFYDTECARFLDTTSAAVRHARYELIRHGYLVQLEYGTGRPRYALRFGNSMAASDVEVA
jgi:hypothetical protein